MAPVNPVKGPIKGDEQPVSGYLGGNVTAGQDDPYGSAPPSDEGEVVGYLEGAAGQEELPLLPPQESQADYSARDFIQPDEEEPPPDDASDYQDYEAAQQDASYFDSMGHDGQTTTDEPPSEIAADGDDQPKTISQQDAESIIKRITTKRIVSTEAEPRPMQTFQQPMTRSGGGFRSGALLLIIGSIVGLGVVAVTLFGKEIGKFAHDNGLAEVARALGYEPPPAVVVETGPPIDPETLKKNKMIETLKRSERIALGIKDEPKAPGGAQKTGQAPAAPAGGGK